MSSRCILCLVGLCLACTPGRGAETRTVHGSANVACRLYIQGEDGKFHFAKSAAAEGTAVVYDVQRSATCVERHTTLSAHPFVVELPPGKYTFTAEHGKEYTVAEETVTVPPTGNVPEVAVPLSRWVNMPEQNWYSGDTHVHRKLDELPNLIEAEDLHVVLPLTYWVRAAYDSPVSPPAGGHPQPKLRVVQSREVVSSKPIQRVIWPVNTEYELFTVAGKQHVEGAVLVLNHKQPLPISAPPAAPVARAAREQGALLDLDKHSWNWSMMIVPTMNVDLFELANNHVWRTHFQFKNWTLDMLPRDWEIESDANGYTERGWIDWGFKTYYAVLNCGFRLRPSAGTASGVHPVPLGFGRVYVECPDGFSYDNWMKGLGAGRSFVTTGPMLRVKFDGQPPGTVFQSARPHSVRVTGIAQSLRPLTRIEIIINGDVARVVKPQNTVIGDRSGAGVATSIDEEAPIEHSAWIAVRCFESARPLPPASSQPDSRASLAGERFRYAHTAPVHFEIDGPVRPRRREVNYFIQRMEQEIARNRGVLAPAEVAEYEQALAIYRQIALRADR